MNEITLIILVVVGTPIALAGWLIVRAKQAKESIEELTRRLNSVESELLELKRDRDSVPPVAPAPAPQTRIVAPPVVPQRTVAATLAAISQQVRPAVAPPLVSAPPAPPPPEVPTPELPSLELPRPEPSMAYSQRPSTPGVNWEQFLGVKLFAWIGGLALFIGVAFFVKYAFDKNLVPPELRVGLGFLAGLGLLVGGEAMSRKDYRTLSQTLCATGVVILYAVTFACNYVYHFPFFGTIPTFLLMALITVAAFLLAVRLDAMVIAILGMLGGFLTPILLSTGQDNPLGLFGYIALLDAGLLVVAVRRRWFFLAALAALGTAILQLMWVGEFFVADKILVALAVLLGFNALYLAGSWWAGTRRPAEHEDAGTVAKIAMEGRRWLCGSTLGLVAVALGLSGWFLDFPTLAQRPALLFGFVFLIDLVVAGLPPADKAIAAAQPIAGLAVFGLLGYWTQEWLSNELLNTALALYFIFAVVHSVLPALLRRRRGETGSGGLGQIFPVLALVLVLVPIFKLAEVSFLVWPFILLVDLLAIALALLTTALLPVLAALLLTLAAIGLLIFKIPADLAGLPFSFLLLGAFVVFFVAASVWLERKFHTEALKGGGETGENPAAPENVAAMLPACSVVFPFLLLMMATLRLPLADPSPVFGLALLLVVLLLGVTGLLSLEWMPAVGLACVVALECAWHFNHLAPGNPNQPPGLVLAWYLIFFALFAVFPFMFPRRFADKTAPWAAAAMAGPPQFILIHRLVAAAWPNHCMGLLAAAFAVPELCGLAVVLRMFPAENKTRMGRLAWFGGVALFFITLIFPIQFERQWITIGWALEGAALLWLFHRVPHPGLRLTGVGLLVAAFVRLALNPAVLEYHARGATPVLNWYLYAYGIVTVALFAGTKLLAPPRHLVLRADVRPLLAGLGTVLAFVLLNIEIADGFSAPGSTLTFQISGNFARGMAYSIGWALFALTLLVAGIGKKIPAARYAAIGLLCVTLLKLFLLDLAQLGQLYRIGAFVSVAVIAMLASFVYQRFFSAGKKREAKE
ncbi:MAG: DUF2339 domain-containing protein [Verrucomicrobiota bacterium]